MPTVIKNSDATGRANIFNLADIAIEAKAIIAEARRQADEIIAQAERARQAAAVEGRQAGFEAGRPDGERSARDDARKLFEQQIGRAGRSLAEAVEALSRRREKMLAEARQELVLLALAVAEKIVRTRIEADSESCRRSVEAAIELVGQATRVVLRVNPEDLQTIQDLAPELANRLTGQADVQVVGDSTIERGGCGVSYGRQGGQACEIDARIGTQLARVAAELLGQGPAEAEQDK